MGWDGLGVGAVGAFIIYLYSLAQACTGNVTGNGCTALHRLLLNMLSNKTITTII